MTYSIDPDIKMTTKETCAVRDLMHALRRLPRGLQLDINEEGAVVRKRVRPGYAGNVALLARKSLYGGL